jgi:N-formylglutamate deformylase
MAAKVIRGDAPLIVAFPHCSTYVPDEIRARLTTPAIALRDTDWWIDQLYDFADGMGITTIRATVSRTVIDVNRDPDGVSLYPGQQTTGLCPTTSFDNDPLWRAGQEPGAAEIAERRRSWFDPYHRKLADEIARLKASSPTVVVYDAHSIRSHIPRLFDGALPVFNIGTNGGQTCATELRDTVSRICATTAHSAVVDGRFRGGWTTRHYGRPSHGVHAIQMELAQRVYMAEAPSHLDDQPPPDYDPIKAKSVRAVLEKVFAALIDFAETQGRIR